MPASGTSTCPGTASRTASPWSRPRGKAPKIAGVTVTASTRPEELQADETAAPRVEKASTAGREAWTLRLDAPQRIVGADVLLKPPVAPVQPVFEGLPPEKPSAQAAGPSWISSQGLVWKPAGPGHPGDPRGRGAGGHRPAAPEPARRGAARHRQAAGPPARCCSSRPRRAGPTTCTPAGRVKQAPGSLSALPESSRAVYARKPLQLGAGESDPHGLPILIQGAERTRPWLAWVAGLAVAVLGFFAWRLLKTKGLIPAQCAPPDPPEERFRFQRWRRNRSSRRRGEFLRFSPRAAADPAGRPRGWPPWSPAPGPCAAPRPPTAVP